MKYIFLLCFYGLPLYYFFSYFERIIILIKRSFFSGYISTKGKIIGYNIANTYYDKERNYVKYRYFRIYRYTVAGDNYEGIAYGDCKNNNYLEKIQTIKYNPNNLTDIIVVADFFKWFSIIILNIFIIIGITIFFKLSFFPDLLLVILSMLLIILFFKGINYLRKNSFEKKLGSKLNLSNGANICKEISNDVGSIHYIKPIHYVNYNSNGKIVENDILNKLLLHDGNFSITLFKQKAILYFNEIIKAYKFGDFNKVRVFATDNYFKNDCQAFKNLNFNDYEFSSFIYSHILDYKVDDKYEILSYQVSVKWKNIHDSDEFASTYYMEFIRKYGILTNINDKVISTNCPNCGADTDVTSVGECRYCGRIITTGDYSWVLNKVSYWDQR